MLVVEVLRDDGVERDPGRCVHGGLRRGDAHLLLQGAFVLGSVLKRAGYRRVALALELSVTYKKSI